MPNPPNPPKHLQLRKIASDDAHRDYFRATYPDGTTRYTYVPKLTFGRAVAAHNLGIRNYDLPSHSRAGISRLIWLEIRNPCGIERRCLTTAHLQPAREVELTRNGWTVLSSSPVPLTEVIDR